MTATRIAGYVPLARSTTMDKKAKTPKKPKTAKPKPAKTA